MWELRVKFYLGQNEECSLGDSTSDSSEELLQRGCEEMVNICDFGEGTVHAIKNLSDKRFSGSHKELMSP